MKLIAVQLYELAKLSTREAFRKRFIYSVFIISLLFLVIDFNCEKKLTLTGGAQENFKVDLAITFFFVSFWSMLVAIVIPSALVADEMENKTYTMILARPVHRTVYLAGKSLGVLLLITANLLFILSVYSIMNTLKNNMPVAGLWLASGLMFFNYILLVLLVILLTVVFNRTGALFLSAAIIVFSTFTDMNYIMSYSSIDQVSFWRESVYWILPQFGSVFLYSTSFIAKMEWNLDYGIYSLIQTTVWILVVFGLTHAIFGKKELN